MLQKYFYHCIFYLKKLGNPKMIQGLKRKLSTVKAFCWNIQQRCFSVHFGLIYQHVRKPKNNFWWWGLNWSKNCLSKTSYDKMAQLIEVSEKFLVSYFFLSEIWYEIWWRNFVLGVQGVIFVHPLNGTLKNGGQFWRYHFWWQRIQK